VSGTYHSTSTDGYQLGIAVLVVKIMQLKKDNIWKGATMQPITTNQQYPTRNAQYITCKQNKIKQLMLDLKALHALGLPCSGLSSSKLVACEPLGTSCSTFSSFKMSPLTLGPTCDDNDVY
jgi:hypothetical protein